MYTVPNLQEANRFGATNAESLAFHFVTIRKLVDEHELYDYKI